MATTIRSELSERNPYHIERERYFELKHFCLQYDIWVKKLNNSIRLPVSSEINGYSRRYGRTTEEQALKYEKLNNKILMVNRAAKEAGDDLENYILEAVTKGRSCNYLIMHGMPCCKDTFYKIYRKFFYILDQLQ